MATNNKAKNIEDPLTRIFEICDRNLAAEAEARKQKEDARLADLRAHNCQPWWLQEQE